MIRVVFIVGIFICLAILYLALPITHETELSVDYSDRYYELVNKTTLTEEERDEMLAEQQKKRDLALEEYSKIIGKEPRLIDPK